MELLLDYMDYTDRGFGLLDSLRLVLLSGDWVPLNLPGRIKGFMKNGQVVSLGGATEASIWSILYPIVDTDPNWKSIPYGLPMSNQKLYVLNEMMEPCPIWVPGQLFISGVGLAKGYWKDEMATSASFIRRPKTSERLYRTGDLGRYLPDGNIEFLGRADFQVKIQGYRIELGEIESTLTLHPGVRSAAVVVMGEHLESKHLVAYIVPYQKQGPTVIELRNFLKNKLPGYMVPRDFVLMDSLPLTPNAKVDRQALLSRETRPSPELIESSASGADFGGRIAKLVASILGAETIDQEANLLNLGVSSVDMIRIASSMERELGFRPKIEEFYESPTIAGLAGSYMLHLFTNKTQASRKEIGEEAHLSAILSAFEELLDPFERE
jgi:acyl carrier protein